MLFARDAATAGMSQSDKMTEILAARYVRPNPGMTRGDGNAGSGPPLSHAREDRDPALQSRKEPSSTRCRPPARITLRW